MPAQEPRLRVFTEETLRVCAPLAELAVGNPWSPSRNEDVARALGAEYVEPSAIVAPGLDPRGTRGNIAAMKRLVRKLLPWRDPHRRGSPASVSGSLAASAIPSAPQARRVQSSQMLTAGPAIGPNRRSPSPR
jgi:hypothetical protein